MNEKYPLALPEGTVLAGQYIVEKVLGQGGFGITYEAKDYKTSERVAVKEFFPDAMATRTNQTTVMPFSGEKGENYVYGKSCFLQEAETLAKFIGNENIVRIHSYFEENGTAYFVMDFIEGTSFDKYLEQHGGKIPYEEAANILIPVMDALSAVHSKGIVHRDVTPDNIYITKEGVVKLLDFGAARYSLGDQSRSLDIILKHGFAPKEQYTRRGKQGPYTDIYALGATFYFALTGKRPPDSVERLDEDDLVPPSSLGVQLSGVAEDAILKALSVQPADRFQNMSDFKGALLGSRQAVAVGSQPAVVQTFFDAPVQDGMSRTESMGAPRPGGEQDTDLQDLANTVKTAGKLAGRLAGRMAGKMAEKTAATAGVMAGTAEKMSEIMAAKRAETAEKLAAKAAEREAEKAAREAERAAREAEEAERRAAEQAAAEAARQAAAEAARQAAEEAVENTAESPNIAGETTMDTVGRTVGITGNGTAHETITGGAPKKSAINKKLFIVPVGLIAAVLIGFFAFKPDGTDRSNITDNSAGTSSQTTHSSQGSTSEPVSDKSTEPEPTTPPEPAVTLSGDWSVVGNSAANILNGGIRIGNYLIGEGECSIWDYAEQKYLFEDNYALSNLTFVDGLLYFVVDGYILFYNPTDGKLYELEIDSFLSGSVLSLLMTRDFCVVCCQNSDGTATVYRMSRTSGEYETCFTVKDEKCFTLSDDGWLYYTCKDEEGVSKIYSMRLDTLEPGPSSLVRLNNTEYSVCNLIVVDNYLYYSTYNQVNFQNYYIRRLDREVGYRDTDPVWKISAELNEPTREDGFGFNINKDNHFIYFYAYTSVDGTDYTPNLYAVKGYENSTFDIERISKNSHSPSILYNSDGTYRLNYLHHEEDDNGYGVYYRDYNIEGIKIEN